MVDAFEKNTAHHTIPDNDSHFHPTNRKNIGENFEFPWRLSLRKEKPLHMEEILPASLLQFERHST